MCIKLRHAQARAQHSGDGLKKQYADKETDHHQARARQHPQKQHVALFAVLAGHALAIGDTMSNGPQGGRHHYLHHQDDPPDEPHDPEEERHHGQIVSQRHTCNKQAGHGAGDQAPQKGIIDVGRRFDSS